MNYIDIDYYWRRDQPATMPAEVRDALLRTPCAYFYVPCEVIVRHPRIVTPLQGRVWTLWQNKDDSLPYVPASVGQVRGPGSYTRGYAYLVEVYLDQGEDGHTRYDHRGYAVLTPDKYKQFVDTDTGEMLTHLDVGKFYR